MNRGFLRALDAAKEFERCRKSVALAKTTELMGAAPDWNIGTRFGYGPLLLECIQTGSLTEWTVGLRDSFGQAHYSHEPVTTLAEVGKMLVFLAEDSGIVLEGVANDTSDHD